jgi:hypothetical protein
MIVPWQQGIFENPTLWQTAVRPSDTPLDPKTSPPEIGLQVTFASVDDFPYILLKFQYFVLSEAARRLDCAFWRLRDGR